MNSLPLSVFLSLGPVAAAFADGWRESAVKALEREFAAFVPEEAVAA